MNAESTTPERQPPLYGTPPLDSLYGTPPTELWLFNPRRIVDRWRTLAAVLGFAVVAAIGYLWAAPKTYQATGMVELSVRRPRIMTQQDAVIDSASGGVPSSDIFNTHLERFRGRTLLLAALDRLDAAMPQAFQPLVGEADPVQRREKRLKLFEKALNVELIRRSSLIRIEFEHRDRDVAVVACNAFAQTVEANAFDENRAKSDAAVAWLAAQADLQRKELLKTEEALLEFRKNNNIDALESQRTTVDAALQEFNRALVELESREAREGTLLGQLEEIRLDPEHMGEFPADVPRAEELRQALERWRNAVVERDSLLATLTPKHPEVRARDNTVTIYRDEALKALERARATVRSNHALLTGQTASLRKRKDEQIQLAAALEMQVVERRMKLTALERMRDAADQTYRGILTRIQDARMAADENTATVKVVERATPPMRPVRPAPLRILAIALILGLGGGLGLVVLTDIVGDRVTGPEDVEGRGIPILAVVPHVKETARPSVATAAIRLQHSEIAEAFASLGTMLDSPRFKERSQVILIASSVPGEGKTVTSCNLASTLARKGRRVLLVDFDMRRPQLAGLFPIPPGRNDLQATLSNPNRPPLEELPYPVDDCPNLHIVASRPASHSHPMVAINALAETLVGWARSRYDHVILDAPPLGLVSDTLALAPLTDLILVMVRPNVSRKRLTWHTLHRFRESGVHSVALVVNDVDFSRRLTGSHSPYYYYQQHYKTYAPASRADGSSS